MESHMEMGEIGSTVAKPCIPHHKCRTCERTRSVKIRVLSWILGKVSLMLIIIVTSATTTFLYHKLLPDDVKHDVTSPAAEETRQPDLRHSNLEERVAMERQMDKFGVRIDSKDSDTVTSSTTSKSVFESSNSGRTRRPRGVVRLDFSKSFEFGGMSSAPLGNKNTRPGHSSSTLTAARLGIQYKDEGAHLRMTGEDPQFFTSGHVRLDGGALLVQKATTLFLSADVILKSMSSPGVRTGLSTVVVCLSLVRGQESRQRPITCHLTYLRERDQQVARVWILFQAEANDRIYVKSSWPSYVLSDNNDQQQSVFTAFEVGHVST